MAELSEAELEELERVAKGASVGLYGIPIIESDDSIKPSLVLRLIAELRDLRTTIDTYNTQHRKFVETLESAASELLAACRKALGEVNDA